MISKPLTATRSLLLFGMYWMLGFFLAGAAQLQLLPTLGFGSAEDYPAVIAQIVKGERLDLVDGLRWLLLFSQFFTFLIPALLYAFSLRNTPRGFEFLRLTRLPSSGATLLVIGAVLALYPATEILLNALNNVFHPDDTATRLTLQLLRTSEPQTMMFNAFLLVVLAPLGEELLFRGTMQPLMRNLTARPDLAIWVTAALFSLMHAELAGFLPRFLLGLMLGYAVHWSGSLWLSIAMHAFHNGLQLLIAVYIYQTNPVLFDSTETVSYFPYWVAPVSLLLSAWLMLQARRILFREGN